MNKKNILNLLMIGIFCALCSCTVIVIALSPAKHRTKDVTLIPKEPDFQYSTLDLNSIHHFNSKIAFTLVDSNYEHYDGTVYPVKESYVFWPNGKCYSMGPYTLKGYVFVENNYYGCSGYYFIRNDSLFTEIFGGNGLSHGYYYYQYKIVGDTLLDCDIDRWYYREPKHKRKIWLLPNQLETQTMRIDYKIDSSTIFEVNPIW